MVLGSEYMEMNDKNDRYKKRHCVVIEKRYAIATLGVNIFWLGLQDLLKSRFLLVNGESAQIAEFNAGRLILLSNRRAPRGIPSVFNLD